METHLRKFDWFVLKPVWLMLTGVCVFLLIQAHWLAGVAILALAVFGVGGVGAGLHREHSGRELAAGYPPRSSLSEEHNPIIDHETSHLLARAVLRLGMTLAIATGILALHFGLRWYLGILAAAFVAWLGPMILMLPFAKALHPK